MFDGPFLHESHVLRRGDGPHLGEASQDGVHVQAGVATRQLHDGRAAGRRFIERLNLFSHLANVGDAKSLVIHPASTTHHRMDDDALRAAGIMEGTIRLSVGLEDPDDLIADLGRALHASQKA